MAGSLASRASAARESIAFPKEISSEAFSILREISYLGSKTSAVGRDLLIRLMERRDELGTLNGIVDDLAAQYGLFPYVQMPEAQSASGLIAYEMHAANPLRAEGFVFHALQAELFRKLSAGENVILSAPTSFGKSAVIDAVIASGKWHNIVIIVPTIALIDEFRRRLTRFSPTYKIVTHNAQELRERNVFVLTQERFLDIDLSAISIDLFMIDEFYKLDEEHRDSGRRDLLNQAFYKLHATGAQYYLTGPNIDHISADVPAEVSAHFMSTEYRTVAVDYVQESIREGENDTEALLRVVKDLEGPTLVYCRSLARVRDAVQALSGSRNGFEATESVSELSDWAGANYHAEWFVAEALKTGIGTHNSAVPRSLARRIVDLFNNGELNYLVCTSSLIEGVNTAARNVVIFDGVLDKKPLDHFTFANISGRAGRMFRNFVGTVVSFSDAPAVEETVVDFPVLSQSERATDTTLLQIDPRDLRDEARRRLDPIIKQHDLSLEVIRANRGLDPELQIEVARTVRSAGRKQQSLLQWSGVPNFEQLAFTCTLIMALTPSSARSGMNARILATRLNRLRATHSDVPTLIREQMTYVPDASRATENVLSFMRNWAGHRVPRQLRALELIVNEIRHELGFDRVSYTFYAASVEALFLPLHFVTLEEYGVPHTVSRKLARLGLRGDSLDELLVSLKEISFHPRLESMLEPAELPMVLDAAQNLGL